jgi:hypothetical protein
MLGFTRPQGKGMFNHLLLDNFRTFVRNHYGLFEFAPKFRRIHSLVNENSQIIMDKNMEFQDLVVSIKKYIKKERNNAVFNYLLSEFRAQKNISDVDLYKNAYIDRRIYSHIVTNRRYHPSKRTVIALGLALNLNLDEMSELLARAGFCLSNCSVFDLAVMYCIENKVYDVNTVNALLVEVGEKILQKE